MPEQPIIYGFGVGFNSTFNKARFNLASYNISNGIGWLDEIDGIESIMNTTVPGVLISLDLSANERVLGEVEGSENRFVTGNGIETIEQSPIYAITFLPDLSFIENVSGNVFGYIEFTKLNFIENVSGEARIVGITYVSGNGSEAINQSPIYAITFINIAQGFEEVEGEIEITCEVKLKPNFSEIVTADVSIGQDVMIGNINGTEIVDISADLGQKINLSGEGLELVSASVSVDAFEEKVCVLTLTLKPGQRLIVDANTYNVWLDGENAVYIQSGDWIDELNRNTLELSILAASGVNNLSARVVFQERYL